MEEQTRFFPAGVATVYEIMRLEGAEKQRVEDYLKMNLLLEWLGYSDGNRTPIYRFKVAPHF